PAITFRMHAIRHRFLFTHDGKLVGRSRHRQKSRSPRPHRQCLIRFEPANCILFFVNNDRKLVTHSVCGCAVSGSRGSPSKYPVPVPHTSLPNRSITEPKGG